MGSQLICKKTIARPACGPGGSIVERGHGVSTEELKEYLGIVVDMEKIIFFNYLPVKLRFKGENRRCEIKNKSFFYVFLWY